MSLENYSYVRSIAKKGIRMDGRGENQRREIKIKNSVINHSDGSAYLELGKTKVIAGVKVLPGEPFPDRPEEGGLIVNFEASELASRYPGDRITYSVEVGRVTDRGIRESNLINFKELVVEPGKKANFVYVDIVTINNDGNLLDAANIAALSAILDTRFKVSEGDELKKLPLDVKKLSISHTFAKIENKIFFDPDATEENILDARLTMGISDLINSMQKGGTGYFTPEEVDTCVGRAFELKQEIKDLLMKQLND